MPAFESFGPAAFGNNLSQQQQGGNIISNSGQNNIFNSSSNNPQQPVQNIFNGSNNPFNTLQQNLNPQQSNGLNLQQPQMNSNPFAVMMNENKQSNPFVANIQQQGNPFGQQSNATSGNIFARGNLQPGQGSNLPQGYFQARK